MAVRKLPPGFEFHRGADGLVAGLSVVFFVKLEMTFSWLVSRRLAPVWIHETARTQTIAVVEWGSDFVAFFSTLLRIDEQGVRILLDGVARSIVGRAAVDLVTFMFGIPLVLTGTLGGNSLERLLVVAGFWVAILVPLWWWGLRPIYFWWQKLDVL